ncbi:MAG: hypothetical protein WBL31_01290 [Ilumatobacteraceae bacterium]
MIVAVALMSLTSCDDDDGTSDSTQATIEAPAPTTTAERPATSAEAQLAGFSSERDDLCEWVTGDEVAEFVIAAGFAVERPATASEPATDDATGWDCAWTFASGEELQLGVRARPGRLDALQARDTVAEYEGPGQIMEPGATVSGHPALSDGVVVENTAFGRFTFHTPGRDDVLNVMFLTVGAEAAEAGYEAALMAMSDSVLGDLGWVPA